MTLSAGARIGPYEVISPLGAGGMGEVWRARDTKLQRDVAVKVLPASVARDPDALSRFEREARAVAALSHPNILAIHDFGSEEGVSYAVMELLEGETLRAKLEGGAISQRKAVEYALQVAQGLAAAHDKGIVHRDLKPENLFVCRDGRVKILDFGLARRTGRGQAEEETSAPTAAKGTDPGTVMGTVGYMSPEQVKGLPVDPRSDLFAFGTILYEMLSGERAFKRGTAPETLTAILREEPRDLASLGRAVDPALERLVRHCLEKAPEERFQSARDLAYALTSLSPASSPSGAVTGASGRAVGAVGAVGAGGERRRFRIALSAGLAAGLVAGSLGTRLVLAPKAARPPEFQVLTYSGYDSDPSASPDGKTIAFLSNRDGTSRIWIKQRAGGAEAVLTTGPDFAPRFSPDGSTLLFSRGTRTEPAIYRVPAVGGEPRKIASPAFDADWSPDGREVVFARTEIRGTKVASALYRVAADGTNERLVAKIEGRIFARPLWSPDGTLIAAGEGPGTGSGRFRLALVPLDGKPLTHIDAPEDGILYSCAWNGDSLSLVLVGGGPVGSGRGDSALGSRATRVLLKDVRTGRSRVLLSGIDFRGGVDVLGTGALVLTTGGPRSNLREMAIGRPGEEARWLTHGSSVDRQPVYAPDGEWVAFSSNRSGNTDIWEVSTKTAAVRRLTDDPAEDFDPAFTRDGSHILFSSNRSGHFEIWMAERDGSGARVVSSDGVDAENPTATPDGKWIVYASAHPEKRGVWKVRSDGSSATLLAAGAVFLPELSPDGRVVSYLEAGNPRGVLHVVRLEDGGPVPFKVAIPGARPNAGRHRWLPGGDAFVFQGENAAGDLGLFLQEFVPGTDTSARRRPVAGFTPDSWTESLGIAPDGSRMTVSVLQETASLLLAEGVDGVLARDTRRARQP